MTAPVRRALLSVSNREGLIDFARGLRAQNIEILSTGGTAAVLEDNGIAVKQVSAHTGFPEIMDGRVKTLHPKIHGGLLGRRGIDETVMRDHGIDAIDLAVINLYPFAATIAKPGCTIEAAIENIDFGNVLEEMEKNAGGVSDMTRRWLAAKAYAHTASYDAAVASYLNKIVRPEGASEFPDLLALQYRKRMDLRYG